MDSLEGMNELKYSAFSKVKQISPKVKDITIGLESLNLSPNNNRLPAEGTATETSKTITYPKKISSPPMESLSPMSAQIKKMMTDMEMLRIDEVQSALKRRQKKIVEFQKHQDQQMKMEWAKRQQYMVAKVQEQEYQIAQALEEYNRHTVQKNEKMAQIYKEMSEKKKKQDEELKEREKRKCELIRITNSLNNDKTEFNIIVNEIVSETEKHDFGITSRLKELISTVDNISNKCKSGNVNNVDVDISKGCLREVRELKDQVKEAVKLEKQNIIEMEMKKREMEEKVKKEAEEEAKLKEQEDALRRKALKDTETITKKIEKFVNKKSLKMYSELQEFQENFQKLYEQLVNNDNLKQFRFDCKKAINIPVNAISNLNSLHLLDKFNKLSSLLSGKYVELGDRQFSAASNPQGILFCMDLLARKFVLQGDLMISNNPDAAFCYSTIILSLWNMYPDFGKLLLAHFYKQCPYLVPIYLPRSIDQTDREYYENLGYKYNDDGAIEKQDKFLKRMAGIMRLYTAIIISRPKRTQNSHPHGMEHAWRWLTTTLNLEPSMDITATMLHVFLETGGFEMEKIYGKQFKKMTRFIENVYFPKLKKMDSGGPATRLELLLLKYRQRGSFSKPNGMLPDNYW